jgi:hypothetical protein
MSSALKDNTGKKDSSKRITGAILISLGGALLMTLGVYSLFHKAADPNTVLNVGNTFIYTGGGLLGISVLEYVGKK